MAAPSCHTGAAHLSRPAPPKYENVIVLPQTNQLIALLTICRDKTTSRADFIFYANRIIRLLVEEGIHTLCCVEADSRVESSSRRREESDDSHRYLHFIRGSLILGLAYNGVSFEGQICGVSIMRAGESMEQGLRDCCRCVLPRGGSLSDTNSGLSESAKSSFKEMRKRLFQNYFTRNYLTISRNDGSCCWIPC